MSMEDLINVMTPSASGLKLAEIRIGDPFPIIMEMPDFLRLFQIVNVDEYILHLILHNSYGFFQFPAGASTANHAATSYCISTIGHIIVWSFDSNAMETKVILMTRGHMDEGIQEFMGYLHAFLPFHASGRCASAFFSMVVSAQLVHFLDEDILEQLNTIRAAEELTGHGDMVSRGLNLTETDITKTSKEMGRCLTTLANTNRHLRIANSIISHVASTIPSVQIPSAQTPPVQPPNVNALRMHDVVRTLGQQIDGNEEYVKYLLERTKSQIAVLQSLLSHDDAVQDKRLSGAMMDIAAETRKDSSAMKTIAVMTMAFLPGTFFAALFAMPMLRWDASHVVQDRFWLYWAFTLPATALVFLVWNVLTSWSKIRNWSRKRLGLAPKKDAKADASGSRALQLAA